MMVVEMCRLSISFHQKMVNTLEVTTFHGRTNQFQRNGCKFLDSLKRFSAIPSNIKRFSKFDILTRNKLQQCAFLSHSIARNHDNYASLAISTGSNSLNSSPSVNDRYQLERIKSLQPSKRFANNRSAREWEQLHGEIMLKNTLEVMDIIGAEQCLRWWISQSRACVQRTKYERNMNNRYAKSSMTEINKTHSSNAAKAIVSALDLFGRVVLAIEVQPELLQLYSDNYTRSNEAVDDKPMNHWYDGYLPRATHLLNAILDAWRLCWIDLYIDNKYLPSPQSIFTLLKDSWCYQVPMNERTYSIVMDASVASMNLLNNVALQNEVPIFCEEIINFMLERKVPTNISEHARPHYAEHSTLPDTIAYTTALNAWARSGRTDAANRAEILFNQFTALCSNGTLPTLPNTFCYNTLLVAMSAPPKTFVNQRPILLKKAWNTEQKFDQTLVDNVLRRQEVLFLAEDMFRSMQHCTYPNVMPNTVSYRTIIFAWAEYSVDLRYIDRNKSRDAMDRAVALLYEMAKLRVDSGNITIDIDFSFFGKIISTLALNQPKVNDEFVQCDLRQAEEVYQYMLDLYRSTRDKRFTPDATLLCAMTLVYAKDGRPLEAEAILTRLENEARSKDQPSLLPRMSYYRDTVNACMDLAVKEMKGGNHNSACFAADKAESLIMRMIDIANITRNDKSVPDRWTINGMLKLWILCQTPQRAENYYRCIESLYGATQWQNLRWNPIHLRYLLSAWANKGSDSTIFCAQQAEKILREMQQKYKESHDVGFSPRVTHISLVISAWVRTNHSELVAKCLSLFDEAMAAYGAGNIQARPDTTLYGSVLKAFSRVGDGQGAMDFLEIMKNDYFNNSNHSAKPNIGIFNMVLLSWLRSKDAKAPRRALHVFETMQASNIKEKLGIEPDFRTFSILCEILETTKGQGFEDRYSYFVEQRNRLGNTTGVSQLNRYSKPI